MREKIGAISCIVASLAVNGCAGIPPSPQETGVSVSRIVDRIQCELAQAFISTKDANGNLVYDASVGKMLDGYHAGVELILKLTNEVQFDNSIKLTVPVGVDQMEAAFGAPKLDDTSVRQSTLNFLVDMGSVKKLMRPNSTLYKSYCDVPSSGFPPADIDLGLGSWVREALTAMAPHDAADLSSADSLKYFLEFTLVRGAGGSITLKSSRVEATSSAGLKQTRDNSINVVFAKNPSDPGPTQIVIVADKRGERPVHKGGVRKTSGRSVIFSPGGAASESFQQTIRQMQIQNRLNSILSPNLKVVPY